jgi:predicted NUDIX family NTP pyrophosphohydrolase
MAKKSSGVLLYRLKKGFIEILLLHPGGPFYSKKDSGVWSIPKGEFEEEEPQSAAIREFEEETGLKLEGDFDTKLLKSNLFELEWPPKSGKMQSFPEMDKGEWFIINEAKLKIHPSQTPFIDRLITKLK